MTPQPTLKAPCNRCLRLTNHVVLHEEASTWGEVLDEDQGVSIDGGDTFTLMKCAGCEDVRLQHRHWFSEETGDRGEPVVHFDYFPPTVSRHRPRWMREMFPYSVAANELRPTFEEVYQAFAAGSYRLAAMGIRSIVEAIMVEQCGDRGTFTDNTKAFVARGFLAPAQQAAFHDALLESGHAAMHRKWEPTATDISTLLDIVEQLIETVYFQGMRSEGLQKKLPPRTLKPKPRSEKC